MVQAYIPTYLPAYKQTDRQTDRHVYILVYIYVYVQRDAFLRPVSFYLSTTALYHPVRTCDILRQKTILLPSTICLSTNPEALDPTILKVSKPKTPNPKRYYRSF